MTEARSSTSSVVREGSSQKRMPPLVPVFALLLACLAAAVLFLPLEKQLVIADYYSGSILLCLPLSDGEEFSIRFLHSVNLSDVTDRIARQGDLLVCRATLFTAYGAGIPDLSDGIGTEFSKTEEGFLLSGIDKAQREIPILLQEVPNHRLLYRGREINLLSRFSSGTLIVLRMQRVSLWNRLTHSP